MIKTYREDQGILLYREAWTDGSMLVVHEGEVGTKGKTSHLNTRGKALYRAHFPTMAQRIATFKETAAAEGYREFTHEEHGWVVLQVWTLTSDLSHPSDAWVLHEARDALDQHLGWLGLGHVDGNDVGGTPPIGEGTIVNTFCRVVDIPAGVRALRSFATRNKLEQKYVIGSREPGDDTDYVLAWSPRKSDRTFTV